MVYPVQYIFIKANFTHTFLTVNITDKTVEMPTITYDSSSINFIEFNRKTGEMALMPNLNTKKGIYHATVSMKQKSTTGKVYEISMIFVIAVDNDNLLASGPNNTTEINISYQEDSTLKAKILSINTNGLVTIEFTKIMYVPSNPTTINSTVAKVEVIKADEDSRHLNFTWNVTSFEHHTLKI